MNGSLFWNLTYPLAVVHFWLEWGHQGNALMLQQPPSSTHQFVERVSRTNFKFIQIRTGHNFANEAACLQSCFSTKWEMELVVQLSCSNVRAELSVWDKTRDETHNGTTPQPIIFAFLLTFFRSFWCSLGGEDE